MERDQATRKAGLSFGQEAEVPLALVLAAPRGNVLPIIALPSSGEAVLGREPPADIVVADDSISRRHARIHAGSPPTIEDLGSTNGTKVMGRLLGRGERAALALGTVVELGTIVAFVQTATAPTAEPPSPSNQALGEPRPTGASMTIPPPVRSAAPQRDAVVADETMRRLYDLVSVIASSRISILILGETGVGKDVYAETVHARSPRASGPFVRLNCAALPENLLEAELFGYEKGAFTGATQAKPGLFEAADGGTVFLDEIGEMPIATQAKLLRVLESGDVMRLGSVKPRHVDVRFVSATNRDLEALASLGQFRSDLYYRLNGVSVLLPPLRRRPDDVVPLARRFLTLTGATPTLGDDVIARLKSYRWPGNIRELKNVIERAALLAQGATLRPDHLMFGSSVLTAGGAPPSVRGPAPEPPPLAAPAREGGDASFDLRDEYAGLERARILEAMQRCGGNQSRAAKMLGISRTTLIKRLEAYEYVRPRKGNDE